MSLTTTTTTTMESVVSEFDDVIRCMKVIANPAEGKFLEYLDGDEERVRRLRHYEGEVQRLQEQVNQGQKTIKNLEMKLKNARHMLDVEKGRRIMAENEKDDLAAQITQVMELLGQGQVNETRERLQQLRHSFSYQGGAPDQGRPPSRHHSPPGPLSTITEDHDSVDTILNVSQMDITEEDDLEDSKLRSGRSYKRRSSPDRLDNSGHKKRSGGKRSEGDNVGSELKTEVTCYTDGEELTSVKVRVKQPVLTVTSGEFESPTKKPPAPPPPTPVTKGHNTLFSPPNLSTPATPQGSQPYRTPSGTPHQTPLMRNYSSASKVNGRLHAFYLKTTYKIEHCQPCGKRVRFGKTCLKCRDCRAICHNDCKEQVPLPCVPAANTPTAKGQMGTIADYTSHVPPMVPALVVHCCNEVENRGLTEVGIYRLCGSDKDIRELKEQFLRGKGLPNLSQVDIHVVSGTLKYFLRSLKEPLITHHLWKVFTEAAEKSESQDAAASLYQAISELPQPNRDTLAWLMCHLQRVAECPECKMPILNLAKVFGPTVVGYSVPEPDPTTMVNETRQQQQLMERLLEMSSDYWNTLIKVSDENKYPGSQCGTPEVGGNLLGGLPHPNIRRRSLITRTPLQTAKDARTPRHLRNH